MPSSPSQASRDRGAYVPPHIQRAMEQHMQQTMPAHLKGYQDKHGYMPEHIEKQINAHMEKTMPGHMQEYIQPYMQQNVVKPGVNLPGATVQPSAAAPAPSSGPSAQPRTVNSSFQPVEGQTVAPEAAPPPAETGPVSEAQAYDFILNPAQPKPKRVALLPSSAAMRVVAIGGGLLGLIILFVVLKGIFIKGPNFTPFITVLQQQQELVHLSTNALTQTDLSAVNQNVATTAQISLGSSQHDIETYLLTNKTKVNLKQLNLGINPLTDTQLTTAGTSGTYNQTFQTVMKTQLNDYSVSLQRAYKTAGQKGKALLSSDYDQAQILYRQLSPPPPGALAPNARY